MRIALRGSCPTSRCSSRTPHLSGRGLARAATPRADRPRLLAAVVRSHATLAFAAERHGRYAYRAHGCDVNDEGIVCGRRIPPKRQSLWAFARYGFADDCSGACFWGGCRSPNSCYGASERRLCSGGSGWSPSLARSTASRVVRDVGSDVLGSHGSFGIHSTTDAPIVACRYIGAAPFWIGARLPSAAKADDAKTHNLPLQRLVACASRS
jgi:hypothetical protein